MRSDTVVVIVIIPYLLNSQFQLFRSMSVSDLDGSAVTLDGCPSDIITALGVAGVFRQSFLNRVGDFLSAFINR